MIFFFLMIWIVDRLPFLDRRNYLNNFIRKKKLNNISLSKLINFSSWGHLKILKRTHLITMLKEL